MEGVLEGFEGEVRERVERGGEGGGGGQEGKGDVESNGLDGFTNRIYM